MPDLEVPDEYDEWAFGARRFVLAEANGKADLHREIKNIVGLNGEVPEPSMAGQFTKEDLAAIVMALGGPQGRRGGGNDA